MKASLKEWMEKASQYLFKCERRTLLWTNPNIDANFDGGTVYLDLSKYDEVEVLCYAGEGVVDLLRVPIGYAGKLHEVGGTGGYNSGAITIITRRCVVSNSGISFTSAYLGYDGMAMTQGFNHNLKPWKIYGIKMGGVLRNPIIATLTAIFTSLLFGGDVDETVVETNADKDPHMDSLSETNHNYKRLHNTTIANWILQRTHCKCGLCRIHSYISWVRNKPNILQYIRSQTQPVRQHRICWTRDRRRREYTCLQCGQFESGIYKEIVPVTISERRWAA